jgi:hypothetical protein
VWMVLWHLGCRRVVAAALGERFAEGPHHISVVLITAAAIIAIVRKIPRLPVREYSGSDLSLLPEKNMRNPTHASGGARFATKVKSEFNP